MLQNYEQQFLPRLSEELADRVDTALKQLSVTFSFSESDSAEEGRRWWTPMERRKLWWGCEGLQHYPDPSSCVKVETEGEMTTCGRVNRPSVVLFPLALISI